MVVLDLSATMSTGAKPRLPDAKAALQQFVVQSVLAGKKSFEVAFVVVGHPDTDNSMAEDFGGYENIVTLQDLDLPTMDLSQQIEDLQPSACGGDLLDGILVGLTILKDRCDKGNWRRRLMVLTDCGTEIVEDAEAADDDDDEEEEEDAPKTSDLIIGQMKKDNVIFDVVSLSPADDAAVTDVHLATKKLLRKMTAEAPQGSLTDARTAFEAITACTYRNLTTSTVFRGSLEIGADCSIAVWAYNYVSEVRADVESDTPLSLEALCRTQFSGFGAQLWTCGGAEPSADHIVKESVELAETAPAAHIDE